MCPETHYIVVEQINVFVFLFDSAKVGNIEQQQQQQIDNERERKIDSPVVSVIFQFRCGI